MRILSALVLFSSAFAVASALDAGQSLLAPFDLDGSVGRRRATDLFKGQLDNFSLPKDTGKTAPQLGLTSGKWTLTAWVKRYTDTDDNDMTIFGTSKREENEGLHLNVRNGKYYMGFYANDCATTTFAKPNQWEFVAFSYEPTSANSGTMSIFVDGKLVGRCKDRAPFKGRGKVEIGRSWTGTDWKGLIKDPKVYENRVITGENHATPEQCDLQKIQANINGDIISNLRLSLISDCLDFGEYVSSEGLNIQKFEELAEKACPCLGQLPDNFLKETFNCNMAGYNAYENLRKMCWPNGHDHCKDRGSYGRGFGVVGSRCPPGKEKIGLLCYSKCPKGYTSWGVGECHQTCTEGFRDDGLFCRRAEYGRGVGYGWKWGDKWWSFDGQWNRCRKDHGRHGCEKHGLLIYPKCDAGYENFGCCICRPKAFDCLKLGYAGQFDISCTKKIINGDPTWAWCPHGTERSGGLCYPPCDHGYFGAGPMCHPNSDCTPTPRPTVLTPKPTPEPTLSPTDTPKPTPDPTPSPTVEGADPTPKPTEKPTPKPVATPAPVAPVCNYAKLSADITRIATNMAKNGNIMTGLNCMSMSSYLEKHKGNPFSRQNEKETISSVCGCIGEFPERLVKRTMSCSFSADFKKRNVYLDIWKNCPRGGWGRRRSESTTTELEPVHLADLTSLTVEELAEEAFALLHEFGIELPEGVSWDELQALSIDDLRNLDEDWALEMESEFLMLQPHVLDVLQDIGVDIAMMTQMNLGELLEVVNSLLEPFGIDVAMLGTKTVEELAQEIELHELLNADISKLLADLSKIGVDFHDILALVRRIF